MNYLENWNFWWDLKIILMTIIGERQRRSLVKIFRIKLR